MAVLRVLLVAFAVLASAQARTLPIGAQRELPIRSESELLAPSPRASRIIEGPYEPLMCADPPAPTHDCTARQQTFARISAAFVSLALVHVPFH
jgi:hypothetical protein